jgi:hypothetical protein
MVVDSGSGEEDGQAAEKSVASMASCKLHKISCVVSEGDEIFPSEPTTQAWKIF